MKFDFQAWVTPQALRETSDALWPVGYCVEGMPRDGYVLPTPRIYHPGDSVRVRPEVRWCRGPDAAVYRINCTTPRCYLVFMYGTVWAEEV